MTDSRDEFRSYERAAETTDEPSLTFDQASGHWVDETIVREAIRQTFMREAGIREAVSEALRESDAALYATSVGRSAADPFDIAPERI